MLTLEKSGRAAERTCPPPFTGEGDREVVEGASASLVFTRPLRLATLATSPVNGGRPFLFG